MVLRSVKRRSATSFGIDSLTHGFKLMQCNMWSLSPQSIPQVKIRAASEAAPDPSENLRDCWPRKACFHTQIWCWYCFGFLRWFAKAFFLALKSPFWQCGSHASLPFRFLIAWSALPVCGTSLLSCNQAGHTSHRLSIEASNCFASPVYAKCVCMAFSFRQWTGPEANWSSRGRQVWIWFECARMVWTKPVTEHDTVTLCDTVLWAGISLWCVLWFWRRCEPERCQWQVLLKVTSRSRHNVFGTKCTLYHKETILETNLYISIFVHLEILFWANSSKTVRNRVQSLRGQAGARHCTVFFLQLADQNKKCKINMYKAWQ